MTPSRFVAAALGLAVLLTQPGRAAAPQAAMPLLERYAAGDFARVTRELGAIRDFGPIYDDLKKNARAWTEAGGSDDRARRRLAAATFALEAARVGQQYDWKLLQTFIRGELIYWKPPAQLVEWGCALLREDPDPEPSEHVWHLAALAVADRAQDFEFLIGSPWEGRNNPKDEYKHLEHSAQRFPEERRFLLAQGIAVEWRLFPSARRPGYKEADEIFHMLRGEQTVGPEATLRLAVGMFRAGDRAGARAGFDEADQRTTDPYVQYLARFYRGRLLEQQKKADEAEAAYRAALDAVPRAQSATFAIAGLMAARGERAEPARLIQDAIAEPVDDPWRNYALADDRFWLEWIAALRAEIRK